MRRIQDLQTGEMCFSCQKPTCLENELHCSGFKRLKNSSVHNKDGAAKKISMLHDILYNASWFVVVFFCFLMDLGDNTDYWKLSPFLFLQMLRNKVILPWNVGMTQIISICWPMYILAIIYLFFLHLQLQWRNSMTIQYLFQNNIKCFHFKRLIVVVAFLYKNKISWKEYGSSVMSYPPILGYH